MRKTTVFLTIASLLMISPTLVVGQSSKGDLLIKNATVMTATKGTLDGTDVLVQNGKIARIGKGLTAGSGVRTIDATGKYVTPGIIDAHSHAMISGGVNEGSLAVTSMTRIQDVLNPTDISIYRALAGGVTGALLLHGSANPIGGQSTTVKFKYGQPVSAFPVEGAPLGIKFALGENVKGSSQTPQPGQTLSYPRTRMGTMEVIRDAFVRAREYKQAWDDFRAKKTRVQPRVNEELQPIVEILEGKRKVHCHGYRSDEHLNILRIAEEFGFKIGTLQHGLEAFKIAPEIAKHGAGVSIFADSWSYKLEAYDATPYTGYILWKNGVNVSINSDSAERIRRLNLDAAKMMKFGGVPEQDALKMITLNPAIQLGIDNRTGSIDVGKDGDITIWSGHPFSSLSLAEMTIIEGEVYFDRAKDKTMRAELTKEREALEKLDMNRPPGAGGTPPRVPTERDRGEYDHDHQDGGNER